MNFNNGYSVLSTIAAAAADVSFVGNKLAITGCPTFDVRGITGMPVGIQPTVAEVLQITTVTPTAANSTVYELTFTQYNGTLGMEVSKTISYTTAASGDTATTICNAWRTQLAQDDGGLDITFSGAATLICTAVTGSPIFRITENSSSIAQSTGTAGVAAVGTYASLTALGYSGLTAGKTYTTIKFVYNNLDGTNIGGSVESSPNTWTLLIQDDATNYGDFLPVVAKYLGIAGVLGYTETELLVGSTALTGALVASVTTCNTTYESLGAGTSTLADGAEAQCKFMEMKVDGGDMVLTPANLTTYNTITFNTAGDRILLRFTGTEWVVLANSGCTLA